MCLSMNLTIDPILPQNERAAEIWDEGGALCDRISHQFADAVDRCVDRLHPEAGERILDVATGTGPAARRAAERGAGVSGLDFSERAIDAASELDQTCSIDWLVGDAEALPFDDGEFDAVISTFGVMFCGDPERAASELSRVCRSDGRLALATWDNHGSVFDMFRLIASHKPDSGSCTPSPFDWAREQRLNDWLGNDFDLRIERGVSFYRERTAEAAWDAFAASIGPIRYLIKNLEATAVDDLRSEFVAYLKSYRTRDCILVPCPYVVVLGTKR